MGVQLFLITDFKAKEKQFLKIRFRKLRKAEEEYRVGCFRFADEIPLDNEGEIKKAAKYRSKYITSSKTVSKELASKLVDRPVNTNLSYKDFM